MPTTLAAPRFEGRRVLTLESRRSPELALLVVNYGGDPMLAPALREIPLESNVEGLAFADALIRGEYGFVVLMTGIGTRLLIRLSAPVYGHDTIVSALAATRIVARGPKPVAALREIGVSPWLTVPRPNTWHELITMLDGRAPGACAGGTRVAVQEYGMTNPDLVRALEARGADVTSVPIYRWALPDDVRPLRAAVHALVADEIDVVILTAGVQIVHLLQVAADMRMESATRRALGRLVLASIGPMTSEELRRQGLTIDLEPTNPKMGFLVKEVAERCGDLLAAKRHAQ
jgi:uroporphyrinogen-III synthase